ncbi:MAG: DUF503 domain-containing protein [Dehalococcoidia bacterium]|nr:DUF503 domain-containing protein [Dehalococcoidia bacterium]
MNVGVAKLTLRLSGSSSLKDKRRVINSIRERVRNKFNVAVAEVDQNESWQTAVIGITCVSNNVRHADQTLDNVLEFIEADRPDAEVVDCEMETLTGF